MIPYTNLKKLIEYAVTANNPNTVEWLCMIAAHESKSGKYLVQLGGGTARGICQVEIRTERDNWENYLRYKKHVTKFIGETSGVVQPSEMCLTYNHIYNIQMAWVWLQRQLLVHKLAWPTDPVTMARYAKKLYNTEQGSATAALYFDAYVEISGIIV